MPRCAAHLLLHHHPTSSQTNLPTSPTALSPLSSSTPITTHSTPSPLHPLSSDSSRPLTTATPLPRIGPASCLVCYSTCLSPPNLLHATTPSPTPRHPATAPPNSPKTRPGRLPSPARYPSAPLSLRSPRSSRPLSLLSKQSVVVTSLVAQKSSTCYTSSIQTGTHSAFCLTNLWPRGKRGARFR
ncbi:hypothetical protein EX30DRAFT_70971 [Ascodesmis nigricans]|uniref:Uncharacterized protein n=1 Tax=Ascodesmis nigricans TaxID=341454 RepID=A0A4V3SIF6_9PEZI|nr:hypothetical protein EX30DRAFT_70971 [Ascodesmis nigricans]